MLFENETIIRKIADILRQQYDGDELAWLYNQNFAADGEKLAYVGDSMFELSKGSNDKN